MLKVLIVGAGSITQSEHLPNWKSLPGADLVGLVNRNRARGQALAEAYGVTWFGSLDEALERSAADAVHVAARLDSHPGLVRHALAAGRHVHVEKPFADSPAVAQELLGLAQAQGVVLDIGYQKQADADLGYVTGLVESGRLGALRSVHSVFRFSQVSLFQRFGPPTERIVPPADDLPARLLDQSIHHVNVLHTWLGNALAVTLVDQRGGQWLIAGASDEAVFSHLNAAASGHGEEFWAYFEGGSVHVCVWSPHFPATAGRVEVFETGADRRYEPVTARQNPYRAMLARFLEKVAGHRPWLEDTARAVADLEFITQAQAAWEARKGTP